MEKPQHAAGLVADLDPMKKPAEATPEIFIDAFESVQQSCAKGSACGAGARDVLVRFRAVGNHR